MRKILLTATILLVAACGGGGGGSSSNNTITNPLTGNNPLTGTNTLSGVASKGLLSGADVQAFEVTSNNRLVAIGTAKKTGTDGSYSLADLPTTVNPVIVKVTVNATTTMLDEISGLTIKAGRELPVGFSMRSFVPDMTDNKEVHIQPFTELAISAAESSGLDLSGETLSAGKDLVVQLLGVSPFTIKPRDPADASDMDSDEKKMMLFLSGVAQDSKTASCSSSTGTACALEKLKTEVKISYDPATKSSTPDTAKIASLKSKVDAQVTTAKTELTKNGSSAFATAMNSTVVTTALPTVVNVAEAQQRDSLDSFISIMRSGFNAAEKTINDRATSVENRIKNVVTNSIQDGFDITNILNNCTKISRTTSTSQFTCKNSTNLIFPTNFTKTGDGKYTYEHYQQAYIKGSIRDVNNKTKYVGDISFESVNNQYLVKMTASGTYKDKKYADLKIDLKATESATEESFEFVKFEATIYDQAVNSNLSGTVSLSGLKVSQDPTDKTQTIKGSAPIKVTTSDGDGFSGSISDIKLRQTDNDGTPDQLKLNGAVFTKDGNLFNLDLAWKKSEAYSNLEPVSARNYEDVYTAIAIKLADNVNIDFELDELPPIFTNCNSGYTIYSDADVNVKITSNKNWIKLSAVTAFAGGGVFLITSPGTSVPSSDIICSRHWSESSDFKDNTIKVTSSGEYSAVLVKTNGKYVGNLLKGTTKIGEISDGIITTGGREISLR
jgi:hypothetical protein